MARKIKTINLLQANTMIIEHQKKDYKGVIKNYLFQWKIIKIYQNNLNKIKNMK